MADILEIFGVEYTNVAGIIATDNNDTDLTYIRPQGTKIISANGTGIDVAEYASVDVAVPSSSPTLQSKTATPTETLQTITADSGYDGLSQVLVNGISPFYIGSSITRCSDSDVTGEYISESGFYGVDIPPGYYKNGVGFIVPNGTAGTPTATKGTVSNHQVSVTPSVTNTAGYISGGTKTGTAVSVSAAELVSGNKAISANGTNIDVTNYATVSVTVDTVNNQNKSVTPTESEQEITADSGYTGLGTVTVNAISSTYVGSGITQRSGSDVDVTYSDASNVLSIQVLSGYYSDNIQKNTPYSSFSTPTITVDSNGLITSSLSVSRGIYKAQTVTATEQLTLRDNTDLTVSGATVTAPAGYYGAAASKTIDNAELVFNSITSHTPTIGNTGGTLTLFVNEANIVTGNSSSSGYISVSSNSSTTIGTAGVYLYSDIPYHQNNSALSVSGATVTVPAGYYGNQVTKSVASGSATAPASINGTAASISTGTNTLTLTKTVSVTPTVSAGYVSSGTAGNSSVSLTASVTTKAAATITPTTTNQTIAAGTYLTGTQTIAGDADLVGSNILSTANIFGVQGTVDFIDVYIRSAAPTSSVGNDGDIYIQE